MVSMQTWKVVGTLAEQQQSTISVIFSFSRSAVGCRSSGDYPKYRRALAELQGLVVGAIPPEDGARE